MPKTRIYDLKTQYEEGMEDAAREIATGGLVVFPTETVYGLGANALDGRAVASIFAAKGRPQDNPLIVHICEFSQARLAAREISDAAQRLMKAFWPGPFTAVLKKSAAIPDEVSAGLDTVGIRLPSSKYARELIRRSGCMIAAPSANTSGKPSPTRASHVIEDLMGKVSVILDGGETDFGVESTVCDLTGELPVLLRPGGVTAEMIRREAGGVEISHAVLDGLAEGEKAASPGMKYKHYSPRANVTIVKGGTPRRLAEEICLLYDARESAGGTPLILCAEDTRAFYGDRRMRCLGGDSGAIAHGIFEELRHADAAGADSVFFEATTTDGMGLAVMNRMLRAAGFEVVDADSMQE